MMVGAGYGHLSGKVRVAVAVGQKFGVRLPDLSQRVGAKKLHGDELSCGKISQNDFDRLIYKSGIRSDLDARNACLRDGA